MNLKPLAKILVMNCRWNIKGCTKYHKIKKMQRIDSFFINFKVALKNTEKDIAFDGFGKSGKWVEKFEDVDGLENADKDRITFFF